MRSGRKLPAAGTSSELPATYGKLAATILIEATALSSKRVDIVFDTYEEPSIKGMERERRGTCDRNYQIIGPQQNCPPDFNEALKSPSLKRELPIFQLNEWKEQAYARIIHARHVYVGHLDECRHFYVEDGVVKHDTIDVLGCNHAEADTRICLHARVIDDVGNADIIIRASDTDIAVIMIHHAWKVSATLWMDTGTSNGKNRLQPLRSVSVQICARPCRPTMRSPGPITRRRTFARERAGRSGDWRAAMMPKMPSSQSHRGKSMRHLSELF